MNLKLSLRTSLDLEKGYTFVDFRKAFDTIWRTGLWKKLLLYGLW